MRAAWYFARGIVFGRSRGRAARSAARAWRAGGSLRMICAKDFFKASHDAATGLRRSSEFWWKGGWGVLVGRSSEREEETRD
jgi:hypothetical protein